MINPWKILGVHRQSTDAEIQAAFHALAKITHPDAGGSEATFQEISEAYWLLKAAKTRAEFIRQLLIYNQECGACAGKGASFKQQGLTGKVFKACAKCGGAGVVIKQQGGRHSVISTTGSKHSNRRK